MRRNILIFGPPGSGKGTQAARIAERRGLAHISTGDMLRAAMAAGSDLGLRVKAIVERGDLVTDELMLDLVRERLGQSDAGRGFLLDGFPRTVPQAEGLLGLLRREKKALDLVILLDVADDELVKRALARGRSDDNESTIRHRLNVYRQQTEPVLEVLDGRVSVAHVDGIGGIDEITERIERALDAEHPA
jgi:adenylate kinase